MYFSWPVIPALFLSAFLIAGGCSTPSSLQTDQTPVVAPPVTESVNSIRPALSPQSFSLRVESLTSGSVLPDRFSCRGAGISPEVSWEGTPPGTKSLVLIVEDPDAPNGIFTHWILYNILPADGVIPEEQTGGMTPDDRAQQGVGTSGSLGYYPPCPPVGSTHRYIFRLYASDVVLSLPAVDRAAADSALAGHTLATTEFVTLFGR